VGVGAVVRVPLGGRRSRGWVVETGERPDRDLKEILGVSSRIPVFDESLLKGLAWASHRYVAPLSVVLAMASPPNLPRRAPRSPKRRRQGSAARPRLLSGDGKTWVGSPPCPR